MYEFDTPLGKMIMKFDGESALFKVYEVEKTEYMLRVASNVNGAYLLEFDYTNDKKIHELLCKLDVVENIERDNGSGENLEGIEYCNNNIIFNFSVEGEFFDPSRGNDWYKYDYNGYISSDSIIIDIDKETKSRTFKFGVAWVFAPFDKDEIGPWFASDPTIAKRGKQIY
ncbi:MAG: hypothetical protein GXZ08_05820 [Tissierellia bacterium]|nr:hypothetical protein [Tissierellia bacterium]